MFETSIQKAKKSAAVAPASRKPRAARPVQAREADPAVQRCSCGRGHGESEDPAVLRDEGLEREADRVADRVAGDREPGEPPSISTGARSPRFDRKCEACEREEEEEPGLLRSKGGEPRMGETADTRRALSGGGRPLSEGERSFFEPRFGRDLSSLRLHTHRAAEEAAGRLGARAFTWGRHVAFGPGEHDPSSRRGRWLMAHEITHYVQQNAPPRIADRALSSRRDPASLIARLGGGKPLESATRTRMEAAFGASFAEVRVHRDARAARLCRDFDASALAVGHHVAFVPHLYRPGTPVGDALLAHELAHVQQQKGQPAHMPGPTVSVNQGDLEADADHSARAALLHLWRDKVSPAFRRSLPRLTPSAMPKLASPLRLSLSSCGKSDTPGPTASASPCTDICSRARADSSLNQGGGGVVCDGATKCACAFDIPEVPLTVGECPDMDAIVVTHEERHLSEVDCDSTRGLHRPPFRDQSQATSAECTHRRESIRLIDRALPRQSTNCRTKMTDIKNMLQSWVGSNC